MCFSAQASFIASAALITISALSFKKASTSPQRLLASGPLFFGIQQALEGIVWLTLNHGDATSAVHALSVYGFLAFAYIFWPIYVPLAIYKIEKNPMRKKIIFGLFCLGSLIAASGFIALTLFGYTAHASTHHIVYVCNCAWNIAWPLVFIALQYTLLALYAIVIIGSMLISSMPYMWLMGLLVALGFITAQIFYTLAFGSVWCFFAALASMMIYFMLSKAK